MLRWFQLLMPKEERFFGLFARHAEAIVAGAEALRAMLEGGDAVAAQLPIVMEREHEADDVTRDMLIAVRRTFITPFDRGDIKDLITSMDNAIDQMQKTAKAHHAVRLSRLHAGDEGDGRYHRGMRAGLVQEAIPLLGRISNDAARISARSPSRFRRSKARPTRCTTSA